MNMEDLYRILRASHVQAQGIVDTVTDPVVVLDASLCVETASRSFYETFGVDRYETVGQPIYELGNGQWDIPELRRLLLEVIPKAHAIIDYEVEHDFPGLGRRTMLLTARTLFHPDNTSHSLLLTIVDVTERRRESAAKDLLFGELRHRMKNLLAVTQSIARLTTTEGRSAEEYRDAFLGRLSALVDAQDIAFSETGEEPDLAKLVEHTVAPYTSLPEAVVMDPAPPVTLPSRVVTPLSLILHELATNAAKYGALSAVDGQVRIGWRLAETGELRIKWVERGGPPVSAPASNGYGTKLIEASASYSLNGSVELTYAPAGLEAEIVIPLTSASLPD
jgi:two-component sensor histidine kinase